MSEDVISLTELRVAKKRELTPPAKIEKMVERIMENGGATGAFKAFSEALEQKGLTVISEVYAIDDDADCLELAYEYEAGDADVISYETSPYLHGGKDSVFAEIRDEVSVPLLLRDYVIDPYQVFEAKVLGADAIVLDQALAGESLGELLRLCRLLRMDALVEMDDPYMLPTAIDAGATILSVRPKMRSQEGLAIGDVPISKEDEARLIDALPNGVLYVSQIGIDSEDDARAARDAGADGVLVRDMLMRATDDDERTRIIRAIKG